MNSAPACESPVVSANFATSREPSSARMAMPDLEKPEDFLVRQFLKLPGSSHLQVIKWIRKPGLVPISRLGWVGRQPVAENR